MACPSNRNLFCYICGEYIISKQLRSMTDLLKTAYKEYFGFEVVDGPNVDYAPSVCCSTCYNQLTEWRKGERASIQFGTPMLWAPLEEHTAVGCYFCSVEFFGHNRRSKGIINYPADLPSAIRPKPHSDTVPIPVRVEQSIDMACDVDMQDEPPPTDAEPSTSHIASPISTSSHGEHPFLLQCFHENILLTFQANLDAAMLCSIRNDSKMHLVG